MVGVVAKTTARRTIAVAHNALLQYRQEANAPLDYISNVRFNRP